MDVSSDSLRSTVASSRRGSTSPDPEYSYAFLAALDDLTDRWERGEPIRAESYLHHAQDWTDEEIVELIYREYRLARISGRSSSKAEYLARFPSRRLDLERLLDLDEACPDSFLDRFDACDDDPLPQVGDEVGPYILEREMGRGGFARVFLARQADLEDRPVVVKVSTKPTREPWLLARARHPNIVEILTHAEVDDGALQLIAMPFHGGAALSSILSLRSLSGSAVRSSGRTLLADLDSVAAPEHNATGAPSPLRAILQGMTDTHAFAWIIARLAEALDHARRQGVAHGDVKPSNILITADATPMLLDFNLAQDWSRVETVDAGGTLAYMAPERLLSLADRGWGGAPLPDDDHAHRADVYSLGMVLLEALTGWSPERDVEPARRGRTVGVGEVARACAAVRASGPNMIRRAEAAWGRRLTPGLRTILSHCLNADPSVRHARGLDLADDLDRWRNNRPLAFAPEPSLFYIAARWGRRHRRSAAVLTAMTAAAVLALTLFLKHEQRLEAVQGRAALSTLEWTYGDRRGVAYPLQRAGGIDRRGDSEVIEASRHALQAYSVEQDPSWRTRDLYRHLPELAREDLSIWLQEHAMRYARVLLRRPNSPGDWRRALTILDHACGESWPTAMLGLRERLERLLDETVPISSPRSPAPQWVDAYLHGIAEEIDAEESPDKAVACARRAAEWYQIVRSQRPDSFWGRYRQAAVAFRLGHWADAAEGVQACLDRRPGDARLHGLFASCLWNLGRNHDALAECDKALLMEPDQADFVQTRAFIHTDDPDVSKLEADINRYEILKNVVPSRFLLSPDVLPTAGSSTERNLPLAVRRVSGGLIARDDESLGVVDDGELNSRAILASLIRAAVAHPNNLRALSRNLDPHRLRLARNEVEKVLALDSSNLQARVDLLCLYGFQDRMVEAKQEFDRVMADPRLIDFASFAGDRINAAHLAHTWIDALIFAADAFVRHEQFTEARKLSYKALELAKSVGAPRGRVYYMLAKMSALGAGSNRKWIPMSALYLNLATQANPDFEVWFEADETFDAKRFEIRAALDQHRAELKAGRKPNGRLVAEAPAP